MEHENANCKTWLILTLAITYLFLAFFAYRIIKIDPFFHYHGPADGCKYPIYIDVERYVNDGIVRHFDYDSIITGSSMSENFRTTEFDKLFGGNSIKVCMSGAHDWEKGFLLRRAFEANKNINNVVVNLDMTCLVADKDGENEIDQRIANGTWPSYLFNTNPFDDTKYILNKSVIIKYSNTVDSWKDDTIDFDNYARWSNWLPVGRKQALTSYELESMEEKKN